MEEKHMVAVYGSLRKGLNNHKYLEDSKLIGTFFTNPVYSLYSLGGFPGLKENGTTSIKMEVYEVDSHTLANLNLLEGIDYDKPDEGLYKSKKISTPYGEAITYIYNGKVDSLIKINDGDWYDYLSIQHKVNVC